MHDGVCIPDGIAGGLCVGEVTGGDTLGGSCPRWGVASTDVCTDLVAGVNEAGDQMAADMTAGAGDKDLQGWVSTGCSARSRSGRAAYFSGFSGCSGCSGFFLTGRRGFFGSGVLRRASGVTKLYERAVGP